MRLSLQLAAAALFTTSCVSAHNIVARQSMSTGDSKCFGTMCVNATVTGSEVEYILSGTGKHTVGWMAIGWGTKMSGSQMVIVWPNSDGTFTLSQRTGTGHVLPTVDSSPSTLATKQQSASDVTASLPSFAFTMPLSGTPGTENIIWAFGNTNPDSDDPDASFTEHSSMGSSSLDLSKSLVSATSSSAVPSPTGGSGNNTSGGTSTSLNSSDRMAIAHGVLCILGFLFFLPLGSLVARYFRTSTSAWFKAHQGIQALLAGPVIIVGWSLGVAVVGSGPHFTDTHTRLGLVLFLLYIIQVVIGNVIHRWKPKWAQQRRPPQNYFHVFLGIVIIGLSFYQVRTGYKDEYPSSTGQKPLPKAADIIFYIWVVVVPVLYFAGYALLPKQFSQEAASRAKQADQNYEMRAGAGDS